MTVGGMLKLLLLFPLLFAILLLQDASNVWSYPPLTLTECQADVLFVMGAAQYDGAPSPAFKRRLDKAYELFEAGCAPDVMVSGGKQTGDRFTEGAAGVRYLAERGVPDDALLSETNSSTSYENLRFGKAIFGDNTLTIVTDDMHAYRTSWLAAHLNLDAKVASVPTKANRFKYGIRELLKLSAYHLGFIR